MPQRKKKKVSQRSLSALPVTSQRPQKRDLHTIFSERSKELWRKRSPEERARLQQKMQEGRRKAVCTWKCVGQPRIEGELSDAHKVEYLALVRRPGSTLVQARQWLSDHGYHIGFAAIRRHRKSLRERLDRAKAAAELAHAFVEVSREFGSSDLSEAVVSHAEQQMMQTFFSLLHAQEEGDKLNLKHWQNVHKAVGLQVKNRGMIEQIRSELEVRIKRAAKEAAAGAQRGDSGIRIARRVSEILGLPPPGQPYVMEEGEQKQIGSAEG